MTFGVAMEDVQAYELRDALAVITESGKTIGLVSLVQRKLGIGYHHAARIVEHLEVKGVLSPADRRGHRRLIGKAPTESLDLAKTR
jgi:DNA segregation ATPase FtsK/SpoIIIE-like protein